MRFRKSTRSARDKALELLTGSEKTSHRLGQDLRRRGYEQEEIDCVVAEFLERGFLDDDRTALALFDRYQARGWGPLRIRRELLNQGVDREFVEKVIGAVDDERERAVRVVAKLVRYHGAPERLLKTLLRRGFQFSLARELTRNLEKKL